MEMKTAAPSSSSCPCRKRAASVTHMNGTAGTVSQRFGGYRTQQKAEYPLQGLSDSKQLLQTTPSLCTCSMQASLGFFLMQRKYFNHKTCFSLAENLLCVSFKPARAAIRGCQHNTDMETQLQAVPGQGSSAGTMAQPSPGALQGLWGPPE